MKRSIAVIAAAVLIIAFSISAHASDKARQITGNVSSIDTAGSTVTVTKKNMEVTLDMTAKTKVSECRSNTSVSSIKIGDKVTAIYKETEDSNAATSITVTKK